MNKFFVAFFLVPFHVQSQVLPLVNAHAHNDYEHERPLAEALEYGFISIEADVHLIDQKLYVSHDPPELLHDSLLLENLYLKPLHARISQNRGSVYPGYSDPVFLMIDFKTHPDSTYNALLQTLRPFQSILCQSHESKNCPVKIFISGKKPVQKIMNAQNRYLSVDGNPSDLGKGFDAALMPVISENYKKIHLANTPPNITAREISSIVIKAHAEGKKVRFWGAPDDEATWSLLLDLGVDLINTDRLQEFSEFMKNTTTKE